MQTLPKDPALADRLQAHQAAIERMKAAGFEQGKVYDVGPDDVVREIRLEDAGVTQLAELRFSKP